MDTNTSREKKKKKLFKETKLGKFLIGKAPKILEIAGDVLPDAGLLSTVAKMIDRSENLSQEEKDQAHLHLKELFALEVEDRDSARLREVEIARTGRIDLMFNLTGVVGLFSFAFIIYAIVYLEIPERNQEVWIHLIGICEGIVISIFGYFYGSSMRGRKIRK